MQTTRPRAGQLQQCHYTGMLHFYKPNKSSVGVCGTHTEGVKLTAGTRGSTHMSPSLPPLPLPCLPSDCALLRRPPPPCSKSYAAVRLSRYSCNMMHSSIGFLRLKRLYQDCSCAGWCRPVPSRKPLSACPGTPVGQSETIHARQGAPHGQHRARVSCTSHCCHPIQDFFNTAAPLSRCCHTPEPSEQQPTCQVCV